MNIDFGVVGRYYTDRGFGFVTRTFLTGHQTAVFFHIKSVRKAHPKLAERLETSEQLHTVYFWYETETTNKGEQVRTIIKSQTVCDWIGEDLTEYVAKVEAMWTNLDIVVTSWLQDLTVDLVGSSRAKDIHSRRLAAEEERRISAERERKEREAIRTAEEERRRAAEEERRHAVEKEIKERVAARAIEEAKQKKLIEEQNALRKIKEKIEEEEFQQLVAEMEPLGFTKSAQVSDYIVKNKLGYKYKKISGILEMELHGEKWNFKGGFPPHIYARLCEELGLGNQESRAKPGKFESFEELAEKGHRF